MKILWLSHLLPFPPQGGGVLQRSANLLKAVAGAHEVTLLAFNQKDVLKIYNPDLSISLPAATVAMKEICHQINIVEIECEKKRGGKLRLALSSLFSRLPYSVRWLTSKNYEVLLKQTLAGDQYDVIWFDTISLAQFRHDEKMNSSLTILNHHNIESDMMFRRISKEPNYLKKVYFYLEAYKLRKYEQHEISKFNINVTCSKLDSERLEFITPGTSTAVIPNGVDTDFFEPDCEALPDPLSLIFIGGMSWYPNREAMLFFAREVWPLLKEKIPNIRMHVVGRAPPQEIIELANNDDNFHAHGFVEDIKSIFNQSGIYICPISDGGGTKLKVLDALAMGKPIVVNPIACEGIDVIDGKNVLFAETPGEYVNKIKKLIDNPELLKEFGRNNRKLILERYSYQVIGNNLLRLLENNKPVGKE